MELNEIAKIYTDFPEKFGIPRQSGLVPGLMGKIVFAPKFRNPDAFRGIEDFSHLWLIWGFSEVRMNSWSPTVRPPRLGGKTQMGVFATRSPFRPNPIGLSCVKLERLVQDEKLGPVLYVSGIDMLSGTPVYDIKPYIPHGDCRPEAEGGFSSKVKGNNLRVNIPEELLRLIKPEDREAIIALLKEDPRTAFIHDEERVWGLSYSVYNIRFKVKADLLTVTEINLKEGELHGTQM